MVMWWKGGNRHTDSRSDAADAAWTWNVSCYSGSLSSSCSLGGCCLLLHLSVALPQVEHLREERNRSLHFLSTTAHQQQLLSFCLGLCPLFLCFKGKTKDRCGNRATSDTNDAVKVEKCP